MMKGFAVVVFCAIQTDFTCKNSFIEVCPLSLPCPDRLNPPKGEEKLTARYVFTQTVPAFNFSDDRISTFELLNRSSGDTRARDKCDGKELFGRREGSLRGRSRACYGALICGIDMWLVNMWLINM